MIHSCGWKENDVYISLKTKAKVPAENMTKLLGLTLPYLNNVYAIYGGGQK